MTSSDPVALADQLLSRGDRARAVQTIATAAALGHADALLRLGLWQLAGNVVPRDLTAARESFRRAAQGGNGEAQLIEIALTANGSGGPADWRAAEALLDRAAPLNDYAAMIRRMLDVMDLDPDGQPRQPFSVEQVIPDKITYFSQLLSRDECAHLINSSTDLLAPAVVVDPRTGREIPHPIRTSDGAIIGPVREDLAIRAINHRIARASDTDVDQGEALAILRYSPGQQYRLHSDALPHTRNQRVKTVLVYLNEGFIGGETTFPDHGVTITPKTGDAVVFTNMLETGAPDARARHAGLPVTRGIKWLATRWIRARPFDVWKGPD